MAREQVAQTGRTCSACTAYLLCHFSPEAFGDMQHVTGARHQMKNFKLIELALWREDVGEWGRGRLRCPFHRC
jgi:hypothetical protein